jgi:hypothetical protein
MARIETRRRTMSWPFGFSLPSTKPQPDLTSLLIPSLLIPSLQPPAPGSPKPTVPSAPPRNSSSQVAPGHLPKSMTWPYAFSLPPSQPRKSLTTFLMKPGNSSAPSHVPPQEPASDPRPGQAVMRQSSSSSASFVPLHPHQRKGALQFGSTNSNSTTPADPLSQPPFPRTSSIAASWNTQQAPNIPSNLSSTVCDCDCSFKEPSRVLKCRGSHRPTTTIPDEDEVEKKRYFCFPPSNVVLNMVNFLLNSVSSTASSVPPSPPQGPSGSRRWSLW